MRVGSLATARARASTRALASTRARASARALATARARTLATARACTSARARATARVVPIALVLLATLLVATLAIAPAALANASHAGWPPITGVLLQNNLNQSRPIDMRPGHDPFDGTDPTYSCDGIHSRRGCFPGRGPVAVRANIGHNELLGGNGNDTIHAGPAGDVIWGDSRPFGQPSTQVDHLYGGPGNDFIYASHGLNFIYTGGGRDVVHAHFGRGQIHCESPTVTIIISHATRPHYRLFDCPAVTYN